MSFGVPTNKNDAGASPSYTTPEQGTSRHPNLEEGAGSALPPPVSGITENQRSILLRLLEKTLEAIDIITDLLRIYCRVEEILSKSAGSTLPPLAPVIPDDLHLIQRRLLEQTRHGFEVSSSFLRTLHHAEQVVGRTQETAEAIAAANLSLEKHWETYVHLMATTFGEVPPADDSHDGDDAGPAPPS